jgi:hypothetical protein
MGLRGGGDAVGVLAGRPIAADVLPRPGRSSEARSPMFCGRRAAGVGKAEVVGTARRISTMPELTWATALIRRSQGGVDEYLCREHIL